MVSKAGFWKKKLLDLKVGCPKSEWSNELHGKPF
jgi:hypothetical protein